MSSAMVQWDVYVHKPSLNKLECGHDTVDDLQELVTSCRKYLAYLVPQYKLSLKINLGKSTTTTNNGIAGTIDPRCWHSLRCQFREFRFLLRTGDSHD